MCAMLAVPIPYNISSILQEINVEGNITKKDNSDHITLFFYYDFDIDDTLKIIPIISEVVEGIKSFNISVDSYTSFPAEDEIPIICKIKSKELIKMRNKIKKALDNNDIKYSTKFKDYQPHITLQYNKEKQSAKFDEIIWPVKNIALYCGDSNNQTLYVEFPFGSNKEKYSSECLDKLSGHFEKLAIL